MKIEGLGVLLGRADDVLAIGQSGWSGFSIDVMLGRFAFGRRCRGLIVPTAGKRMSEMNPDKNEYIHRGDLLTGSRFQALSGPFRAYYGTNER